MSFEEYLQYTDLLPQALFLLSSDGTVLAANRAAAQLLEVDAGSLCGKHLAGLVLDPEEKVTRYLRLWARNGQLTLSALDWRRPTGGFVSCRCDGALVRADGHAAPRQILLTCWPKTQEKMFQRFNTLNERIAALKDMNEELEARVARRTEELAKTHASLLREMEMRKEMEEELFQFRKLESIGTLAAGIAHDFNNILNIILGYAAWIERKQFEPETHDLRESVEAIKTAVERGSEVVKQLLTFARSAEFSSEPVSIRALMEDVAALVRHTFPKTIDVVIDVEEVSTVLADRNQLQQVLLNLCINARDAMPFGGTIVLRARGCGGSAVKLKFPEAATEDYICLTVADTGTGIDEDVKPRIFEPFFTTKEVGRGTGLGLAVAYGIVKNHAGFIALHSEKGIGTSFDVFLPAQPQHAARAGTRAEAPPQTEPSRAAGTVLLVEDEPNQLHFMKNALGDSGYRVITASDGLEAVDRFNRHKKEIDVVFLDVGLPKLDGLQVVLKIKELQPDARIVLATGYLAPPVEKEIAGAGISDVIHKPYVPGVVASKIRDLLGPVQDKK